MRGLTRHLPSRLAVLLASAVVLTAACGDSEMALDEYAAELESAVTEMAVQIDILEPAFASAETPAEVAELWEQRVAARQTFLDTLEDMSPPGEAADVHEFAIGMMTRLTAAERALGEPAAQDGWPAMWDSPEGDTARAVDQEAIAFCMEAQAGLTDPDTEDGFAVEGWLNPGVREVIEVVFGCVAEDRPTAP